MSRKTLADRIMKMRQENPSSIPSPSTKPPSRSSLDTASRRLTSASTTTMNGKRENSAETENSVINILKERRIRSNKILLDVDPAQLKEVQPVSERISDWQTRNSCTKKDGDHLSVPSDETRSNISSQTSTNAKKRKGSLRSNTTQYSVRARVVYDDSSSPSKRQRPSTLSRPLADIIKDSGSYKNFESLQNSKESTTANNHTENKMKPSFEVAKQSTEMKDGESNAKTEWSHHTNAPSNQFDAIIKQDEKETEIQQHTCIDIEQAMSSADSKLHNAGKNVQESPGIPSAGRELTKSCKNDEKSLNVSSDGDINVPSQTICTNSCSDNTEAKETNKVFSPSDTNYPTGPSTDNRQSSAEVKHVTKVTVVSKQNSEVVLQGQNLKNNEQSKEHDLNNKADIEDTNSKENIKANSLKDTTQKTNTGEPRNTNKSDTPVGINVDIIKDGVSRQDISTEINTSEDIEKTPFSLNDKHLEGKEQQTEQSASNIPVVNKKCNEPILPNTHDKDEKPIDVNVDQKHLRDLSTETTASENDTEKSVATLPGKRLMETDINNEEPEKLNQYYNHEMPINSVVSQRSHSTDISASASEDIKINKSEKADTSNSTKRGRHIKYIDSKHVSNQRKRIPAQNPKAEHTSPNLTGMDDIEANTSQKSSVEKEEKCSKNGSEQINTEPPRNHEHAISLPSEDDSNYSNNIRKEQLERNGSIGNDDPVNETMESEIDTINNPTDEFRIDPTKDAKNSQLTIENVKINKPEVEKCTENSEIPKQIAAKNEVENSKVLDIQKTTKEENVDAGVDKNKNSAFNEVIVATDTNSLGKQGKTQKNDDKTYVRCNDSGNKASPVVSTAKCQDVNLEERAQQEDTNQDIICKDTNTKLKNKEKNVNNAADDSNGKTSRTSESQVTKLPLTVETSNFDANSNVQSTIEITKGDEKPRETVRRKPSVSQKNKPKDGSNLDTRFRYLVQTYLRQVQEEHAAGEGVVGAIGKWKKSKVLKKSKELLPVSIGSSKDNFELESNSSNSTSMISIKSKSPRNVENTSEVRDSIHVEQQDRKTMEENNSLDNDNGKPDVADSLEQQHEADNISSTNNNTQSNNSNKTSNKCCSHDNNIDRSSEQIDGYQSVEKYEQDAIIEKPRNESSSENPLVNTGQDLAESNANKDVEQLEESNDDTQLNFSKHIASTGKSQVKSMPVSENNAIASKTQKEIDLSETEPYERESDKTISEDQATDELNTRTDILEEPNDKQRYTKTTKDRSITVKADNSEIDSNKSQENCENDLSNELETNKISTSGSLNDEKRISDVKTSNENCQIKDAVGNDTSNALHEGDNQDTSDDKPITPDLDCSNDFYDEKDQTTNTPIVNKITADNRYANIIKDNSERYQTQGNDDIHATQKAEKVARRNKNECAPVLLSKQPERKRNKHKTARKSTNLVQQYGDRDNNTFEDSQPVELPRLSRLKRQYTSLHYAPPRENSFYGIDNQDDYKFGDGTLLFQENEKIKHTSRVEEILMELYFAQKPEFTVQNGDRLTYQYFNTNMGFSRSSTKVLKSSKEFLFDRQNTFDYRFAETIKRIDLGKQRETSFYLPSPRGQCRKLKAYARLQKKLSHVLKQ